MERGIFENAPHVDADFLMRLKMMHFRKYPDTRGRGLSDAIRNSNIVSNILSLLFFENAFPISRELCYKLKNIISYTAPIYRTTCGLQIRTSTKRSSLS